MGIPHSLFEAKLQNLKNEKGVRLDTDLTALDLKELVEEHKNVYLESRGERFPSGNSWEEQNQFIKVIEEIMFLFSTFNDFFRSKPTVEVSHKGGFRFMGQSKGCQVPEHQSNNRLEGHSCEYPVYGVR